jgi:hypothetical protein
MGEYSSSKTAIEGSLNIESSFPDGTNQGNVNVPELLQTLRFPQRPTCTQHHL